MNPGQHRKSNSGSVNSHAVMSGKHQMGQGIGNMKFVKPSELQLDLIGSNNNMRNLGVKGAHSSIHNNTALAGGAPNTSTNN